MTCAGTLRGVSYGEGGGILVSEAQKRAQAKYDAQKAKRFNLKLNIETDADILRRFEEKGSVQTYIKQLIREDIRRERESRD